MKKYFVLFGAMILAVALVSSAMAQAPTEPFKTGFNMQPEPAYGFPQFKTWGHLEIQTIWEKRPDFNTGRNWQMPATQPWAGVINTPGGVALTAAQQQAGAGQGQDMTWKHVAERFRFHLQYGDAKTVRAVLGFEADSQDWGEPGNPSPGTGGNTSAAQGYAQSSNHIGVYRSDMVQLEVMWAFLEFMVPNTPIQVAAGVQRFMVGGRLWMQNDAPGLKVRALFAPHNVEFFWWRQNDRARNVYQPNDYYGLIYQLDQKAFNVYAWGAYNNDLYNTGAVNGAAAPGNTIVPAAFGAGRFIQSNNPYWIAIGGGFRPGNFEFNGQVVYNGGKMKMNTGDDFSYDAWALELNGKYRIGPGMFFGLEYFYSTGNDTNKTTKIKYYTAPSGTESGSIFGNDRTVFFWMNAAQMGYYHERQFLFGGMSYYRANFEYSPTSWIRMNLNYLYIEDQSKGSQNAAQTLVVNTPTGARQDVDSRKIGQEINLITTLNIYKNFVYHIGLAMFLPGDVYNVPASPGINAKSAETAYALNTKLVYAF